MEFTRIDMTEGASFNPLPQKVPMRYSFSLEQKRILMKHYENGMHGQSLAYQDKIVACAQEAGVDFDIVRNWIGNMRRKRRMENAQKNPMTGMMLQHDQSIENKRRFLPPSGAFPGPQYFIRHPSNGGGQQPHPAGSMVRVGNPNAQIPLPTSIMRNAPLTTRDQNVTPPCSGQPTAGVRQPPAGTQAMFLTPPTKQESEGDKSSCLVAGTAPQSLPQSQEAMNALGIDRRDKTWNCQFPDETIPVMRSQGSGTGHEMDDNEWRQQQIQGIMNQVQQSVHQLESLGCECVVATVVPSDGGTYITGTPVAVQYFSEIQKIQAMADYVNPVSPPSAASNDTPNDTTEEVNDATNSQRNQPGPSSSTKKEEKEGGDCLEGKRGDQMDKSEETKLDLERREEEVIRAGEEVYIVNKEHYIIGTGTLLPAPHRRIELKNAPPS